MEEVVRSGSLRIPPGRRNRRPPSTAATQEGQIERQRFNLDSVLDHVELKPTNY